MQIAWPPVGVGALVFASLVVVLRPVIHDTSLGKWALAGAVMFATWWAILIPSLLQWSPLVQIAFIGAAVTAGAVFFTLARAVGRSGRLPLWAAVPAAWTVSVAVLERTGFGTLSLSAVLVSDAPLFAPIVRLIGGVGIDAVLWCVATLVASKPLRSTCVLTAIVVVALAALSSVPTSPPDARGRARIVGLQPAVDTVESASVGLSFTRRRRLVRRLDHLTAEALRGDPNALVVWPEGGNRLANAQLSDRLEQLGALTAAGKEVVAAGLSIESDGRVFSALQLFSDGHFIMEARKAAPVPLAESHFAADAPGVLPTAQGNAGIQICYDSLRWAHAIALRRGGADFIIVSSDDASFGRTPLSAWHRSISLLHAIEAGLPMAFLTNAGPSAAFDADGRRLDGGSRLGESTIVRLDLPLSERTPWEGNLLVELAMFLIVSVGALRLASSGLAARRCPEIPRCCESSSRPRRWRARATRAGIVATTVTGALTCGSLSILLLQAVDDRSLRQAAADWRRRARPPRIVDEVSPLYRQSRPMHCGAAAVGYAVSMLGEEVFEADVIAAMGRVPSEGYSLADLAAFARAAGFDATGFRGNYEQLLREPGSMSIAHLRSNHFVVVVERSDDAVLVFDPALGERHSIARETFEATWSRHYLRIVPPSLPN